MAVIPFVTKGQEVRAAQMNALYAAFDGKLTQLLSGKSFLLGQRGLNGVSLGAIHPKLMGKCFFFTEGQTFYSNLAPGFIADGDGARNYDANQFATVAAAVVVTGYDETLKIAHIEQIDAGDYDGLPQSEAVGFFEHSLQVWSVDYQGAGDAAPVPYFFREPAQGAYTHPPPEKRLRYGLAEILIESDVFDGTGQGSLAFAEPAWVQPGDTPIGKYGCYRIHNLQAQDCEVIFRNDPALAADLVVELGPYECQTVRQTEAGVYAATGWHYFFPYRTGGAERWPDKDPRFFSYLPTKTNDGNTNINDTFVSADQPRAANSLAANNLTNAAVLADWIVHFDDAPVGFFVPDATLLGDQPFVRRMDWAPVLMRDLEATGAEADLWPFYQNVLADPANPGERLDLFGDPTNPATLLGDLIHYKGRIVIIRKSKTITDPSTGQPQLTRDEVFFRGWATIVEDFAAKLLTVETRTGVDQPFSSLGGTNVALVVDNADPDNDVELIPLGTNLFHNCYDALGNLQGGPVAQYLVSPTLVALPAFISPLVYQYSPNATWKVARLANVGQGGGLNDNAANVVQRALLDTLPRQERDYQVLDSGGNYSTSTVTAGEDSMGAGCFSLEFRGSTWYTLDGDHNINQVTVADLLALTPWGEAAHHPDQSNEYVAFSDAELQLTWQGWVIKFQQVSQGFAAVYGDDESGDVYTRGRSRRIYFRDWGWPQLIGGYETLLPMSGGSAGMLWFSPRTGRHVSEVDCGDEEVGASGGDFTVGPLGVEETEIRQIRGPLTLPWDGGQGDLWLKTPNSRFWRPRYMDNFQLFLEEGQTDAGYWSIRSYLQDGPKELADDLATTSGRLPYMTLLAETYNALAGLVNSCTRGLPLNAFSLWFKFQDPDEAPGTMKVYHLPEPGADPNVSTQAPVPLEEYAEVAPASDFDELCTHLALSVRDDSDLPEIGPSIHGAPDPSSLSVSKYSLLTETVTYTPSDYGIAPDSDPGNPFGYLWTGDITIARTLTDGTDDYYAALTGPALEAVKGIATWRTADGFAQIDLKSIYADYRWVSFGDVTAAFGRYGIPVIVSQVCQPLALQYLSSPRDYTASFARGSSLRVAATTPCDASATTPASETYGPSTFAPAGITALQLRSGYWFGPAPTAQDYEDPEEVPAVLAMWKTMWGCAPGDKLMNEVPTWWLAENQPLGDGLPTRDSMSRLTLLTGWAQASYATGSIHFGHAPVEDTFGTADFPGLNPAGWAAGWIYHGLTWESGGFLDEITQTHWRMMLNKNCANEAALVHDQYWTALPDVASAQVLFENFHADTEPVFNQATGWLGTVVVPNNEYRTLRPVAVAGNQPFHGVLRYRSQNAYIALT